MNYSLRKLFFDFVGQTSPFPLGLEVESAEGIYVYGTDKKKYMDLISGIAVSNLGHGNKRIIQAIKDQADKYIHTMVYGEHIQSPQVEFAKKLTGILPENFNSVFYTNSGSEAVEGAMKLAKRYTGRYEIVACRNGYHGNTQGSQSLMDNEYLSQAYRPFVPGIRFIEYNNIESLNAITNKTAAVITETIQGDIGIKIASDDFLRALRIKCNETGSLLVFDEIQTGFGRTGKFFAFEHYDVVPDVLLIAKAMGGGMPTGALVSDKEILKVFTNNPILGYISTFGGHPVSLAAAVASLDELQKSGIISLVREKEKLFLKHLKHPAIKEIRHKGLFFAVDLGDADFVKRVVDAALDLGVLIDWFLYNENSFRLAPPLIISEGEIIKACEILVEAIDKSQ
ncbi:MAG TPA: aspartate aminotransferase family protein [Bacteroidetes bacterium]|nr:aspartate aminotransferase family protein [Bacteroidota bacterium]